MDKKILTICAVAAALHATAECPEGACPAEGAANAAEGVLTLECPVAPEPAPAMPSAPRLETLAGKTFAVVGGSFMAKVTHPELKRLILAECPGAKVYVLSEIGSGGPWPRSGVVRREKEEFQRRLREFGVDAVISGNGGCGLCTPKEAGSCIAAEALGIPSVMIAAPTFAASAKAAARAAGLEDLQVAEYPGAFASDSRETLLANTRKALWPQIKAALTKGGGAGAGRGTRETRRKGRKAPPAGAASTLELPASEVQKTFLDSGWTDGLPVIPPTVSAVEEFLRFTPLPPEHSLGAIPPAGREATVRRIAANGVMAGCRPEAMPLLVAITEAMKDGNFRRPLLSTHGWTPYCIVNGPIARKLGLDCGQGGISSPANMAIGRFINLAMQNLAGYRIKENRMGTFGYPMPWCVAEDEEACRKAGWAPLHVQQGFAAGESAVTMASAINWGNNLSPATADPERIKDLAAFDATEKSQMAVKSGMPCTWRVFLATGGVAKNLSAKYRTKEEFAAAVEAAARIPLGERAYANYYGNPGSAFDPAKYPLRAHARRIARMEGAKTTPVPPWLEWTGLESIESVPAMARGKCAVVVAGDPSRNKMMCLPGGGFKTVAVRERPRGRVPAEK